MVQGWGVGRNCSRCIDSVLKACAHAVDKFPFIYTFRMSQKSKTVGTILRREFNNSGRGHFHSDTRACRKRH